MGFESDFHIQQKFLALRRPMMLCLEEAHERLFSIFASSSSGDQNSMCSLLEAKWSFMIHVPLRLPAAEISLPEKSLYNAHHFRPCTLC